MLARHLIERGSRRIVFFTDTREYSTVEARIAGVRKAVNLSRSVHLKVCFGEADDLKLIGGILSDHQPDGIACVNDMTAAKVLRSLLKSGVKVPREVKLTGFDDTPTASLLPVPLTTVRQMPDEMAIQAMNILRQRMERPYMPTLTVTIACTLVDRESTAAHES